MDRCKTPPTGLPVQKRMELPLRHELCFLHHEVDVGTVRSFVKSRLTKWGRRDIVDDALVIINELVTNALVHARSNEYAVAVDWNEGWIRLEVWDQSLIRPRRLDLDLDALHGRGIRLVEALSMAWGSRLAASGKCVWAVLPLLPKTAPELKPSIKDEGSQR